MRLLAVLALVLVGASAWATPPRVVSVEETLFAVNGTHIFVLRRLSDNFGYYDVNQTDVTLIARNRETGQDDQHWPVLSIRDKGRTFAEFEPNEDRVANLGLPERVNPYDIALWRKAWLPVGAGQVYDPDAYSVSDGVVRYGGGSAFFMAELARLQPSLTESLEASRATIPFNPSAGPASGTVEAAQIDPLFAWPLTFSDDCRVTQTHHIDTPARADAPQKAAKLACNADEHAFSVFVILTRLP